MRAITHATVQDIVNALGKTRQAVLNRSLKERWQFEKVPNPNGGAQRKEYPLSALPSAIRAAVLIYRERQSPPETLPALRPNTLPAAPGVPQPPAPFLPDHKRRVALARADLVRLYQDAVYKNGGGRYGTAMLAKKNFVADYNTGLPYPTLFSILKTTSWQTLERWSACMRNHGGLHMLADRRGDALRGRSAVNPDAARILLLLCLRPTAPKIASCVRQARRIWAEKGIEDGLCDYTYYKWIMDWQSRNYDIWVFSREGKKAWNDKVAFSIERDYDLIDVGDVVVADGHNLNFEIMSPWTGKPKRMALILWYDMKASFPLGWEIMPTEDTAAIASALRRAILTLGKMPKVAYLDNGRAFRSRFFAGCPDFTEAGFSGLFENLGMKVTYAWPYHGQSKTIERFFGTFNDLERQAPTYSGASIADKPPRMNRGEKLHRAAWDKIMGGQAVTLAQAHAAIAAWFDEYAARQQKAGHLAGIRPADVFSEGRGPGVDADKLTHLMMAHKTTKLTRDGVKLFGRRYYAPELYGRTHAAVVRYDFADPSAVYVYGPDNEFICRATQPEKCHPMARHLGADADVERLTEQIHAKKSQEKDASVVCRTLLTTEILPQHKAQMEQLGFTGGEQMALPQPPEPETITPEDFARIAAEAEESKKHQDTPADHFWSGIDRMTEDERYEKIMEGEVLGLLVPRSWQWFARYFESRPVFEANREHYETRKAQFACTHQVNVAEGK
jgi:putative transposase